MNKTHEELSALSPLNRLRIERICKNVKEWDFLWKDVEGARYLNMTPEEIRNFNAMLNVIANDTMNTLSSLKKSLAYGNPSSNQEDSFIRVMEQNINPDS